MTPADLPPHADSATPEAAAAHDAETTVDAAAASSAAAPGLVRELIEYLHTWLELLSGETALARSSFVRLLIAAVIVPIVGLTAWIALNALLVALAQHWLGSWIFALAGVLAFDAAVLLALVLAMRRWSGDLSLPRSRAALKRLWQRMG